MWLQKNSKRYLRTDIFEKYYQLLKSSAQRTNILALQKLDEILRDGYILLPSDGNKLDSYLLDLLGKDNVCDGANNAVRRCAYRLCARRNNPRIRDICLRLLKEEICLDNKMSIIPVLSQNISSEKFNQSISTLESISGLSYQQIRLAQFACPDLNIQQLEKDFIYSFLDENDITALRFLPIIFDEQPPNSFNGLEYLNNDLFGELANHSDPWVQKYALGTFSKRKRFHIEDLKINPSEFLSMDAQPLKWIMTDIFLDKKFIGRNQDFVRYILSEHYLFTECDNRTKEGIAQGLLRYGYNTKLADAVISWYSQEKNKAIKVLLRSYMLMYQRKNREFDYILKLEKSNYYAEDESSGLYLPEYIRKRNFIFPFSAENKAIKLQSHQSKEVNCLFYIKLNKFGSIEGNYVEGDVINSTLSVENSIRELEKKINSQGGDDSEELKKLLEEVKELIENMETSRSIPKQKQLFKKISDHATKHGWFYAEIVALLGQQIINMLSG